MRALKSSETAFLVLLAGSMAQGQAQSVESVSDLLQRVAATYTAITDYVINVSSISGGGPLPSADDGDIIAQEPTSGAVGGGFIPTPIVRAPVANSILIARSGDEFHYDINTFMRLL